jgi:penicillin-binding protein 1C
VLPDVELHVATPAGDYAPRDYDERFRGPVRLREALGNSLNVPAVWTAEQLGVPVLLDRLRAVGFASLQKSPEYYGPGLALGDGEVTLLELVRAYAGLARGGRTRPLRVVRRVTGGNGQAVTFASEDGEAVVPEAVAAQITDVLRDKDARRGAFGERTVLDFDFDVAAKTGTSKGYRDNWAVGFSRDVTVGVWVGNFDGSSMRGTSGISGAGPLFHAVMVAAMRAQRGGRVVGGGSLAIAARPDDGSLERIEVCALSGEAPGPGCTHRVTEWMPRGDGAALPVCSFHERVRIDRQSGLRAGPGCAPAEVVEEDFERYPPEYGAWASAADRPLAPALGSPRCPPDDADARVGGVGGPAASPLQIANVDDGARYAIDPDRPRAVQTLDVRVTAPRGVGPVRLRVDGAVFAVGEAPYRFAWPLEEGEHVLVAEADGVAPSEPAHLRVRGL